ncbi:MAG TPA: CFI-box-CTERM domain-containing protein [Desulfobacteria bacterium]|nr:CFI-box-CTERM domain-containing protein [Desulfobacteria bacterium]
MAEIFINPCYLMDTVSKKTMRIVRGREALFPLLGIVVVLLCLVITAPAVGVVDASTARTLSISALDVGEGSGAPGFIEIAAYGTPNETLAILREFRDTVLLTNSPGTFIADTYAVTSPPIATVLEQNEPLRTATRLLLLLPVVYFSALCLNTTAFAAFVVLILLILLILRRHVKVLLKGIGYGALIIAAFTVTVFTFGALGYELPICATVAAYLLPLIIPAAVAACVMVWIESRSKSKPRVVPYSF